MRYEVKFIIGKRGFKQTVEADSEAMAKQIVLSAITFVAVEPVKSEPISSDYGDIDSIMEQFGKIFGGKI